MTRSVLVSVAVVSATAGWLGGCSSGGGGGANPTPTPIPSPGTYLDALEPLAVLSLTPPIPETLESRALPDGRVLSCTSRKSLIEWDATNPSSPVFLAQVNGTLSAPSNPRCQHLAFTPANIFIASRGDEFQLTPFITAFDDTVNPPAEIATYTAAGRTFEGLAASGTRLYAAMHGDGLAILDLVGTNLVLQAEVPGFANAWGVAVEGNLAYVADGTGGLKVVDVTNPGTAAIIGQVDMPAGGFAQSVELDPAAQVAWIAAGTAGLVGVDISTPVAPMVIAHDDTPGTALQVALANGRAHLADWDTARIYDVTVPSAPVLLTTETVPVPGAFSRVLGLAARGDDVFLGEWTAIHTYRFTAGRTSPDVRADPAVSYEFGIVAPGSELSDSVALYNDGQELLVVYDISTTGPFEAGTTALAIQPGATANLPITFAPANTAEATGTLSLVSDDPDQSPREIVLRGNRPGVGVGDAAPQVLVNLLGGGTWQLSDHLGQIVVLGYFGTF